MTPEEFFQILIGKGLPVISVGENYDVTMDATTPEQKQIFDEAVIEYLQPERWTTYNLDKLKGQLKIAEQESVQIRLFINTLNLSELIISTRLSALDPFAQVHAFTVAVDEKYYVAIISSLTDPQITNELAYAMTVGETDAIVAFANSISNFNSIDADWASKSADDLIIAFDNSWFAGKTLAQIQADINGSANYKVAMNQLATYLYAFRDNYCHKQIRATAALRDYLIRLRRQASTPTTPTRI